MLKFLIDMLPSLKTWDSFESQQTCRLWYQQRLLAEASLTPWAPKVNVPTFRPNTQTYVQVTKRDFSKNSVFRQEKTGNR